MKKKLLFLVLSLCFSSFGFCQKEDYNAVVNKYISLYKNLAISEMKEFRIPASITLAQGILESNAGRSPLAVTANNHFGIKCHKGWTGKTFYQDDETKNECFRKYAKAEESFRDHSAFLTQRERYKQLFKLDITDYKGWATGLKAAGYATNPNYAQLLIKTIETFGLQKFDRPGQESPAPDTVRIAKSPHRLADYSGFKVVAGAAGSRVIYENNGLRLVIATEDDNLYQISRDCDVTVSRLLKYNDLSKATDLKAGQIVYLQAKKRKAPVTGHKVAKGDSLYTISQYYGIRMKLLVRRNGLRQGAEPAPGRVLKLR